MEKLIDFKRNKGSGFKLKYIPERDLFQLHASGKGAWEGGLREIWQKNELGV